MAAADLSTIRAGIKTVVGGLTGMGQVFDFMPDTARGRCAVVGDVEPFDLFGESFGNALLELTFPVTLIAGEMIDREAAKKLNAWLLSSAGIWQAFIANRTLSGVAEDCIANEVRSVGEVQIGDSSYLAAEVAVRVLVRRDS